MVAAYLVGTRGTAADAMLLGAHRHGLAHRGRVRARARDARGCRPWVLPEDLYPWLTLASGVLVVGVGAHPCSAGTSGARRHAHDHAHDHHLSPTTTVRAVADSFCSGASAGIIPCPSALVVLLGAIAQHELGLGLALIVAFSAGLAATLMGLGLAVVWTRRLGARLAAPARLAPALAVAPAVSSLVIIGFGVVLAARAVPTL